MLTSITKSGCSMTSVSRRPLLRYATTSRGGCTPGKMPAAQRGPAHVGAAPWQPPRGGEKGLAPLQARARFTQGESSTVAGSVYFGFAGAGAGQMGAYRL